MLWQESSGVTDNYEAHVPLICTRDTYAEGSREARAGAGQ